MLTESSLFELKMRVAKLTHHLELIKKKLFQHSYIFIISLLGEELDEVPYMCLLCCLMRVGEWLVVLLA